MSDHSELASLQTLTREEVWKFKKYRIENIPRKHNYLPLCWKSWRKEVNSFPFIKKQRRDALKKELKTRSKT